MARSRSAKRGTSFALDSTLAADTVAVGELGLCRALLMNDRRFPWLILVPRRGGKRDLDDLSTGDQTRLMADVARAARALKALFSPHKLNVAALGNVVAQLHVHVIARQTTDAAWSRPVWGVGAAEPYGPGERDDLVRRLVKELGRKPPS